MNNDFLGETKPTLSERVFSLAEQALPIYERQRILKAQLEQARAGRAPIDVSQMRTPAVPVEFSLKTPVITPQVRNILIAAGIGAVIFFAMRRKRKG